jgi:hypothetical protein
MVEMSVRQHYRFNVAEIQAHPGNVAFESVWIRAGVEKDGSRLCAKSGGTASESPWCAEPSPSPVSSCIPAERRTRSSEAICGGRVESISLLLSTTTETVSASSAESRYGSSLKLAPRELGCPTKQ